jgi:hypothetical protein
MPIKPTAHTTHNAYSGAVYDNALNAAANDSEAVVIYRTTRAVYYAARAARHATNTLHQE